MPLHYYFFKRAMQPDMGTFHASRRHTETMCDAVITPLLPRCSRVCCAREMEMGAILEVLKFQYYIFLYSSTSQVGHV